MPPANLDVTVFILDIGYSESETHSEEDFFEKARSCIIRILERKIFSRPDDLVALILMGTNETNNDLAANHEDLYVNISQATALAKPDWTLIRNLRDKVKPTNIKADWFDALIVAVNFITTEASGKKVSQKQIALVSDLKKTPEIDDEKLEMFIDGLKNEKITLNIIGPEIQLDDEDVDDDDNRDHKKNQKLESRSESVAKKLLEGTDGIISSFEDAFSQFMFYKRKAVNPSAWNVNLTIGPEIKIPVSAYGRIKAETSIKSWKTGYKNPETNAISSDFTVEKITKIIKENDNTSIVPEGDVITGYKYGKTVIPYSEIDQSVMGYNAGPKCLSMYGFTKKENVSWNDLGGQGTYYIYGQKNNINAQIALKALITAMDQLGLIGIARRVYNNGNAPSMFALFPVIESETENEKGYKCLSMVQIFYKEDYRHIKFPPLNYTGNVEQVAAVDSLIDAMDLDIVEDGEEAFKIGTLPNPSVQYSFDCIAFRALNPDEPLPGPRPEVKALLEVPPLVRMNAKESLQLINNVFSLKEKEKPEKRSVGRKKTKQENGETVASETVSKLEPEIKIESFSELISTIGTLSPVDDFRELIAQGEPFDVVSMQVIEIVEKLLFGSLRDETDKVLNVIREFRKESVQSNPGIYNKWMESFKVILLERSKRQFFENIIKSELSLITMTENEDSVISANRANLFADLDSINDDDIKDFNTDNEGLFDDF